MVGVAQLVEPGCDSGRVGSSHHPPIICFNNLKVRYRQPKIAWIEPCVI